MSAPASAGGKLRLSDVVRALRAHELELDCKAVLLSVNEDGAYSVFDIGRVDLHNSDDIKLLLLHLGLQALAVQTLNNEPDAVAAVAAADARHRKPVKGVEGLLEIVRDEMATAHEKAEAEDGKEVCHD